MYRVYIRSHEQQVFHKTTTGSPLVAEAAFRELMWKKEFWATRNAAVLSLNGRNLEFRRFDRIIPADAELAKNLRQGIALPAHERWLVQVEGSVPDRQVIECWMDADLIDRPILQKEEPVRLFFC